MITVILRGGLGNQMFEYAAGLALARRRGVLLRLDTTFLNDRSPRRQFTYRAYDLDLFDIHPKFTRMSAVSSAVPIPAVWLGLDIFLDEAGAALGLQKILKEKQDRGFEKAVYDASGNVTLWGFWQNEQYFADSEDAVRAAFRFKDPLTGEALQLKKDIEAVDSVAIHVRRGDYLLPANAYLAGAIDDDYYSRSIAQIVARVKNPRFFVFSDDIAWCREHIKPPFPTVYVDDATRGPKASFHLQLMSLCKHDIIPRSSFSWWGAWLNRNPEKIVIKPE